jgi:hypothetical protein
MSIDSARFLRLKSSVEAALAAFPIGQTNMAGKALTESYNLLRNEAKLAIPDGLQEEFERLFPELDPPPPFNHNPMVAMEAGSSARAKLALLAGWLDSIIEKRP